MLDAWAALGGTLWLGRGSETSCFLMAREGRRPHNLWPVVLYPTGKCEVVFQHMAIRKPFDDVQLRQEFRERLKLLADAETRTTFIDAPTWFCNQAYVPTD